MARQTKPLTAKELQAAKPKEKKYKLSDGQGLFLLIEPNGSKVWRLKYRFENKEKEYAIGVYPTITLVKARQKRGELRELIADGININDLKKQNKITSKINKHKNDNTFYKVSQEWLDNYESEVSENYHIKLGKALENYVYSYIKNKAINEISRLDIIEILQDLKKKDLQETGKRVFMLLNKIFKYAVTLEYAPHNIIADIEQKIILGKRDKKHYPTFTKAKDIKALLLAIDEYSGDYTTKMAIKMLPYICTKF